MICSGVSIYLISINETLGFNEETLIFDAVFYSARDKI